MTSSPRSARLSRPAAAGPASFSRPSIRRSGSGFAKANTAPEVTPAPAKHSIVSGNLVFAVSAFLFGVALLLGWRFGPAAGNPNSFMLVGGLLSLFFGGWTALNELGILSAFSDDSDNHGGGDGDGD